MKMPCSYCSSDWRYCPHGAPSSGITRIAVDALVDASKVDQSYSGCVDRATESSGLLRSFVADVARRYQSVWMRP